MFKRILIFIITLFLLLVCLGSCTKDVSEVTGNDGSSLIIKVGIKEYKILNIKPNRDVGFYILVPKDTSVEVTTVNIASEKSKKITSVITLN